MEYSCLFSNSEDEPSRTLKQIYSLLKDNGSLIIAIENKLGLKYFAGYKEDHLGKSMYGIENRYQKKGVKTFGKLEIEKLLKANEYKINTFLFPFPDYKFPTSIISEEGLKNNSFDPSYMISTASEKDNQKHTTLSFEQIYTWQNIYNNGLVQDLSNSFLIISQKKEDQSFIDKNLLAFHYRSNREVNERKELIFRKNNKNKILVYEFNINQSKKYGLLNNVQEIKSLKETNFIEGKPLLFVLIDIIKKDEWSLDEIKELFRKFKFFVYKYKDGENFANNIRKPHDFKIEKRLIDATFWNVILKPDGEFELFDLEYVNTEDLYFTFLLFRNLYYLKDFIPRFGNKRNNKINTWGHFSKEIFKSLDLKLTNSQIRYFIKKEKKFQRNICNKYFCKDLPGYSYLLSRKFLNKRIKNNSSFEELSLKANFVESYLLKVKNKLKNLM